MSSIDRDNLDSVIDAALKDEAFQPVPLGLHRRIEERLWITVLLEEERQRFRSGTLIGALLLLTVAASAVLVLVSGFPETLAGSVPGAMGFYDYYMTSLALTWSHVTGSFLPIVSLAAGATLFLILGPVARLVSRRIRVPYL